MHSKSEYSATTHKNQPSQIKQHAGVRIVIAERLIDGGAVIGIDAVYLHHPVHEQAQP